jgi:hypothetical protein
MQVDGNGGGLWFGGLDPVTPVGAAQEIVEGVIVDFVTDCSRS